MSLQTYELEQELKDLKIDLGELKYLFKKVRNAELEQINPQDILNVISEKICYCNERISLADKELKNLSL